MLVRLCRAIRHILAWRTTASRCGAQRSRRGTSGEVTVKRKIILLGQIRSAFVATALVASIPATTIRAETGPLENGFDLARRCESNDAAEKLFCVSFLSGVYTTAIALGELVGPPVLCPASSVSGADILAMFETRNNPQHLDTRPEVTALLAFRNAVGCPK